MSNANTLLDIQTNRLYDAEALISAAIAMVDTDCREGNEIFRVLSLAKKTVADVAVSLDSIIAAPG